MKTEKVKVNLTLRPEYNDKLARIAVKEGVGKGVVVEGMLKKVKEPKEKDNDNGTN